MSRHIVRFSYGAFLRVLRDKRALVISDNGKKSLSEERRMGYLLSYHTDTGRVKNVNQDALLLQSGCFKGEQIVLAVLCDGLGGLEKGEAASAAVIRRFAGWFRKELPWKTAFFRPGQAFWNRRMRQLAFMDGDTES